MLIRNFSYVISECYFFFAVKTPVKSRVSELFQQNCEKSFKKILPRQNFYFTLLHNH